MPSQAVLGFSVDDGWEKAMSPAIAFGLIFASFFVFGQPYFQLSKWANDVAGVIAIGVMHGVPSRQTPCDVALRSMGRLRNYGRGVVAASAQW